MYNFVFSAGEITIMYYVYCTDYMITLTKRITFIKIIKIY